ncbi:MAG TPA: TIGR01777 family oxidoreductase [Flavisolibacter sp.]
MINRIVLAGGSGYLGRVLADYYKDKAHDIVILSRKAHAPQGNVRYLVWDGRTYGAWTEALEGCDLLVNLSGKNVNCRYTEQNRREILSSRVEPTKALGEAIKTLKNPPKMWMQAASATIYRHAEDRYQDEETGELGSGFSVDVCRTWESVFWEQETPGTIKVVLRIGLVLGRSDGVFPRLKNLVRFGLGGHQGTGLQYISWIHEQDFARVTEWVFEHGKDGDILNCVSPQASRNKEFMRLIRNSYGIGIGLPAPQWLLEIGAVIIGTETELILKSRWVYPGRLLERGFRFSFPEPGEAVREVLGCRL